MKTATKTYKTARQNSERDELVVEHLGYVRHILRRIVANLPESVDVENLESAGILGLVEAAHQFDDGRGVAFKTFAYQRIRSAIIDELRRNCPLPQQMLQQIAVLKKAHEDLEPPVTPEMLARATHMSVAQVEKCLEALRLTRPGVWDDSLAMASDCRTDHSRPDAHVEHEETKRVLADSIEQLPQQERIVVTLYYLEDLRLKEIGKVLKLSESRVSRILAKAEFRLKEYVRIRGG